MKEQKERPGCLVFFLAAVLVIIYANVVAHGYRIRELHRRIEVLEERAIP